MQGLYSSLYRMVRYLLFGASGVLGAPGCPPAGGDELHRQRVLFWGGLAR